METSGRRGPDSGRKRCSLRLGLANINPTPKPVPPVHFRCDPAYPLWSGRSALLNDQPRFTIQSDALGCQQGLLVPISNVDHLQEEMPQPPCLYLHL